MAIFSLIKSSGMSAPVGTRTRGGVRLRLTTRLAAAALGLGALAPSVQAQEMYLGQLILVGYNFCPRGWIAAAGQIMAISQNQALFALLGTQFGGNGVTTFALPDLRGRTPIGQGQGPGLAQINVGQAAGTETVTLLQSQMPAHTHALIASNQPATHATPDSGKVLAQTMNAGGYAASNTANVAMAGNAIGTTGGGQSFSIRNPYLGMTWCIALQGIFPSQD